MQRPCVAQGNQRLAARHPGADADVQRLDQARVRRLDKLHAVGDGGDNAKQGALERQRCRPDAGQPQIRGGLHARADLRASLVTCVAPVGAVAGISGTHAHIERVRLIDHRVSEQIVLFGLEAQRIGASPQTLQDHAERDLLWPQGAPVAVGVHAHFRWHAALENGDFQFEAVAAQQRPAARPGIERLLRARRQHSGGQAQRGQRQSRAPR